MPVKRRRSTEVGSAIDFGGHNIYFRPIDAHKFPCYPTRSHTTGTRDCARGWGRDISLGLGTKVALFLSTVINKLDKKGRVSVPAAYRAGLAGQSFHGIIAYPSFVSPSIEGCGVDRMERISASIDEFDPFSEEHDAFAVSILSNSHQLPFDSEGRIFLPNTLISHAGVTDRIAFVGLGATFQLWEPERFTAFEREARERARSDRNALRLRGAREPRGRASEDGQ